MLVRLFEISLGTDPTWIRIPSPETIQVKKWGRFFQDSTNLGIEDLKSFLRQSLW